MLVTLRNKVIFKNKESFEIKRTEDELKQIEEVWNKFIIGKNNIFNGDIYAVTNIKQENDQYELEIGKTKFADLIYAKETNKFKVYSLFSSILFKTKDNYYVVVKDSRNRLNLFGGMASDKDFIENTFNPELCLSREVKEELGISLDDKTIVSSLKASFVKIPDSEEAMYPTGIVYTAKLNLTKEELTEYFGNKKEKLDNEIKNILFYTNDNYLEMYNENDIREYIIEAIKIIEEEK